MITRLSPQTKKAQQWACFSCGDPTGNRTQITSLKS